MKKFFSIFMMCLSLSSLMFVSCEKEGNGDGDGADKVCFFDAKVQMTQDFIDACESISFEYKDANGQKVTKTIEASALKAAKYVVDGTNKSYDVLEWSCKFDYKNCPAEVYFKPTVKIKESVSFETKPNFIFYPMIYSGVHANTRISNHDSAYVKVGVNIDYTATLLTNLSNVINRIEVNTTVGE